MAREHFDVLIVGAGLSGIGAGYHLQTRCPGKSYAILEARGCSGGTWDLFRYPGIRSDSDMFTLGYSFKPWTDPKAIADGPSILSYVRQTAAEHGIDRHIRFGHRVISAGWSSPDAMWTVEVEQGAGGQRMTLSCRFLLMCSGYYNYARGYTVDFPGAADFRGQIVHPQHWPADLDHAGKRVVVIGSGATAVTLVPEMARTAAHVTMLQRSPSYVIARPSHDRLAEKLRGWFGPRLAYQLIRWRNVLLNLAVFKLCRAAPASAKALLLAGVRAALGADYDLGTHFTPRYNPWEQRLCLVPDGDLFRAIARGGASVVTGAIETFTERGVRLDDGAELAADLVVTATGLDVQMLGGAQIIVDGTPVDFARTLTYKSLMFSDVPNLASVFGYTNASWTLKSDLIAEYVCRLLTYMDRKGYTICTPHNSDASLPTAPWVDFSSGYLQRALPRLPRQGLRRPWTLDQNYLRDILTLRFGRIDDGVMRFS